MIICVLVYVIRYFAIQQSQIPSIRMPLLL
jgi:hypothetical protein